MLKKITWPNLIAWLFYLLVFLLPWQTRWLAWPGKLNGGFWEYGTFSLYAIDLLWLLVLLLFVFWQINQKPPSLKTRMAKLNFALLTFFLAALLSTFWASDKSLAWYGFWKLSQGLSLVWLLASARFIKTVRVVLALVMGAAIQSWLAIWQFLAQSAFSDKWLGLAEHSPGDLGASVLEAFDGRWLRAYGALPHPNILAGFLAIALLLLISLGLTAKERYQKLFVLIGSIFTATALFFTFSRGAFVGLIIGLAVYGLAGLLSRDKKVQKRLTIWFLLLLITFGSLAVIFREPFMARATGQGRLESQSINQRLTYYGQAGELLKNNWYHGIGINNYTLAVKEEVISNLQAYDYQPVHNVYLLILAELSIFGLLIFLYIACRILFILYYFLLVHKGLAYSPILAGLNIALIASLVMMLFDHYFWTLHFGIFLFWLLVGLLAREIRKTGA
ncbi:MAG: O-antigen ligase family protein [bacterium]